MIPLIPSPGSPKTTRTPHSSRRSTSTSAVVRAIWQFSNRSTVQGKIQTLLLTLENPGERSDELFEERPPVPAVAGDLAAPGEVALDVFCNPGNDIPVPDRDVYLVVVLERPIVEIRRAHHGPEIVHEQRLDVRHPAAVLVDADAGADEAPVQPAAREANPSLIRLGTRHQDDDLDAARGGAAESLAERPVRQEVRRRDDDTPTRAFDEELEEHARRGRAIRRRALDDERRRRAAMHVRLEGLRPGQDFAAALQPVFGDDPRDVRHERSEERRVGKECRSRWSPYP